MAHCALTHAGGFAASASAFTRLFQRSGPALEEKFLIALASTMEENQGTDNGVLPTPPAGYTYLGQFIDHDLVADPRSLRQPASPAFSNGRTPRFDLDSMYGDGPAIDAHLYDHGPKLRLGADDFLRNGNVALLKDGRNDSNLILSQMHVAFTKFHNRVAHEVDDFELAQNVVCQHYQWAVLHDYLPMLVGRPLVDEILGPTGVDVAANLRCFRPGQSPAMPLEFSAAAFRFGHSMVREGYQLRNDGGKVNLFVGDAGVGKMRDLRGFRPVPPEQVIQWQRFFDIRGSEPQRARPIDTFIVPGLFRVPKEIVNGDASAHGRVLPYRNLYRCEIDLGLPTGQDVLRAMRAAGVPGARQNTLGIETPLSLPKPPGVIDLGGTGVSVEKLTDAINGSAPLWYYVLAEAALAPSNGVRLGFVGGRIVAETLIGLMLSDPMSILNTGWRPTANKFGATVDAQRQTKFGMAELLQYAIPV